MPCRAKETSNIILNIFLSLFKKINPLATVEKKRNYLSFKGFFADLTRRFAKKTLGINPFKRLKSFSVHAQSTLTHCIRNKHVLNKVENAFVKSTIKCQCARHRNCCPLFHTCLQRNIGSCKGGEKRGG